MPVDRDYLREHYASLSDEALLEINREELVKTAQECYDDEVGQRGLDSGPDIPAPPSELKITAVSDELKQKLNLSPFYKKCVDCSGFPVPWSITMMRIQTWGLFHSNSLTTPL